MRPLEEITEDIESGFSSPVMRDFCSRVLHKDYRGAMRVLKAEAGHYCTDEELRAFLADSKEKLRPKGDIAVQTIDKSKVKVFPLATFEDAPTYLVRVGAAIFISRCLRYRDDKEGVFTNHGNGGDTYRLSEVDQVLEIKTLEPGKSPKGKRHE